MIPNPPPLPKALQGTSTAVPALANLTPAPVPPSSTGATPPPVLEHFYVAVFAVRGQGTHVVEVPHTQKPDHDRKVAWMKIHDLFPKAGTGDIRRTGNAIQSRPFGQKEPAIQVREGMTIRQLFEDGSDTETSRHIGCVVFNGVPCHLALRFIRAKSAWSISLKEVGMRSTINFSEQHTALRLVKDLPEMILKTLGGAASGLRLFFTNL